jgi:hypothetical protein
MKFILLKYDSKQLFLPIFLLTLLFCMADIPVIGSFIIGTAEARVGRPASPVSGAGVARRTTRRHVRRRAYHRPHVVVLPVGCTTVIRHNVSYRSCGSAWYEPYYYGDELIYVVVGAP